MIKLAHNLLGHYKQIITRHSVIEWKYIEALHKIYGTIIR